MSSLFGFRGRYWNNILESKSYSLAKTLKGYKSYFIAELTKLAEFLKKDPTSWFRQSISKGTVQTNIPTELDKSMWPLPSSIKLNKTLDEPVNLDNA